LTPARTAFRTADSDLAKVNQPPREVQMGGIGRPARFRWEVSAACSGLYKTSDPAAT
jgi:hypothetical protein